MLCVFLLVYSLCVSLTFLSTHPQDWRLSSFPVCALWSDEPSKAVSMAAQDLSHHRPLSSSLLVPLLASLSGSSWGVSCLQFYSPAFSHWLCSQPFSSISYQLPTPVQSSEAQAHSSSPRHVRHQLQLACPCVTLYFCDTGLKGKGVPITPSSVSIIS